MTRPPEHLHDHRDRLEDLQDDPTVRDGSEPSFLAWATSTPLVEDWLLWRPDGSRETHETCTCEWGACPVRRVPHPSHAGAPTLAVTLQAWARDHDAEVTGWECFSSHEHPQDRPFLAAELTHEDGTRTRIMAEHRHHAGRTRPVVTTEDGNAYRFTSVGWTHAPLTRLPPTQRVGFPEPDETPWRTV